MCRFKGLDYYYHSEIHLFPLKISEQNYKKNLIRRFGVTNETLAIIAVIASKIKFQSIANNFDKTVLTPIYIFFILSNVFQHME